ncbi:UNVERIFIED_CONTAM: hypothetical protein HDU68_000135 [Siphonaria sp. JEL0065]|nr:hypothetical protein HDU68_000135 [Siphonaria sp. JEL0065]
MTKEDKDPDMGEATDWGGPENDVEWDKDKAAKEDKEKEEKDEDIDDDDTDNRKSKATTAATTTTATTTTSSKPAATIIDRTKEGPFLIKVVVRVGSHKDPKEAANATGDDIVYLHTWKDATLREIACLLSPSKPDLKDPEARLSFKAIFLDPVASSSALPTRRGGESRRDQRRQPPPPSSSSSNAAYKAKELGQFSNSSRRTMTDESRTLEDVKFIVGDVLEIAIVKGFSIVGASSSSNSAAANVSTGGGSSSNVADRLGPRRGSVSDDRRGTGGHEHSNGRSEGRGGGGRFHPYGGGRDGPREGPRAGGRFQRDGHDHRENTGHRGGRW